MSLPLDSANSLRSDSQQTSTADVMESRDASQVRDAGIESLAQFFEEIAPRATRFAMSMTGQWGEAEELVQEACFRMTRAEQSRGLESQPKIRTAYLFRTIRNLAIDRKRRVVRRPTETVPMDALPANLHASTPGQQARRLQQIEDVVEQAWETMPESWASALKLKINGELSYQQIAETLEATPDQVRGWIYRARKKLAAELKQRGLLETSE